MKTYYADHSETPWTVVHPVSHEDQAAMASMRAMVEPNKGRLQGVAARAPFDSIMERVIAPENMVYEADSVGGIPGLWARPRDARSNQAVMHIHGGWFNFGSAKAFRHLAGHIAASVSTAVFVPDYRLAPEYPSPAAVEDVRACYFGLINQGLSRIAITGDSAGGNLALGLLAYLAAGNDTRGTRLVGGVALSPVTDLQLLGDSWSTRAESDPLFTKPQAAGLVDAYLAGSNAADPLTSPLNADLKGLAPLRVHVGNDDVLLDDSVRFVERAVAAGVDAHLDVWDGMIHGFLGSVGHLAASDQALQSIGQFLTDRLAA